MDHLVGKLMGSRLRRTINDSCPSRVTDCHHFSIPIYFNTPAAISAARTEKEADIDKNGCRVRVRRVSVDEREGDWTGGGGLKGVLEKRQEGW